MALVKKTREGLQPPKNIEELRDRLLIVFNELDNGAMKPNEGKEINNSAGKILGTIKAQHENSKLREERPNIAFLKVQSI